MTYQYLKVLHILLVALFFGAGLASAVLKIRADRTQDTRVIAFCLHHIIWADWLFTVPSGIGLPVTGIWMASLGGLPLFEGWTFWGLALWAVAGAFWLPAAYLQVRMLRVARMADHKGQALPPEYARWTRYWLALGFPSFGAAVTAVCVMVTKHAAF